MPSRTELLGGVLFVVGALLVAVGPTVGGLSGFAIGIGAVLGLSVGTVLMGTAVEPEPVRDLDSE
ncbi:hypothetical protein ACKVMT_05925 [Halobacteriales archaeon Cl-PHB]